HRHSAAQHQAVARVFFKRQDQRLGLEIAHPHRVKSLVVETEWCQKTACGDCHIAVSDVIDFGIVDFLFDWASVWSGAVATSEIALEGHPRLDQPLVPDRNQEHWSDHARKSHLPTLYRRHK